MRILNTGKNTVLAEEARIADSFFARLKGLIGHKSLNNGEALVLKPSNSIHSLFMRFTIDAVFVDKDGRVIAALRSFKPFRLSRIYWHSCMVIELPENTIRSTHTEPGDTIQIL